jgi:hypothetical protein
MCGVDRRTLTVLAVAGIAILALSVSAATLTSTLESEGDGSDDTLPGGDDEFGLNQTETDTDEFPALPDLPAVVEQLLTAVILASIVASVVYMLRAPRKVLSLVAIVVVFGVLFWLFFQIFSGLGLFDNSGSLLPPGGGGEGSGGGSPDGVEDLSSPLALILVVLLGVVLVGVMILLRRDDEELDGESNEDDAFESGEAEDRAVIGAIAGRTADRIEAARREDGGTENEVYRAWREMTDQLELDDPETATPREFQHHAVTAGMASEDVRELTRLFERVRYGGESATEDRERRAVSVLRRIESAYGGEK